MIFIRFTLNWLFSRDCTILDVLSVWLKIFKMKILVCYYFRLFNVWRITIWFHLNFRLNHFMIRQNIFHLHIPRLRLLQLLKTYPNHMITLILQFLNNRWQHFINLQYLKTILIDYNLINQSNLFLHLFSIHNMILPIKRRKLLWQLNNFLSIMLILFY